MDMNYATPEEIRMWFKGIILDPKTGFFRKELKKEKPRFVIGKGGEVKIVSHSTYRRKERKQKLAERRERSFSYWWCGTLEESVVLNPSLELVILRSWNTEPWVWGW